MADSSRLLQPRLPGLSVVLPLLDDEQAVATSIAAAAVAAEAVADSCEIVVVDDASSDHSGAIAQAIATRDDRVVVVTHPVRRGPGAAMRSGIAVTRMPWVLLADTAAHDFADLPRFAGETAGRDLVTAYIPHRHTRVDCPFQLARGDRLRSLWLTSDGAALARELVARAERDRWRITALRVGRGARGAHATARHPGWLPKWRPLGL
jgi:glycosyltransferase involved in cell wall biosynthesis